MQQLTKARAAIFLLLAAMLTVGLQGCGSDTDAPLQLSGKLKYRATTALPKTATARVSMFEQSEDGGDKRIVAERSMHDLGKQPIEFKLDVARKLINPEGSYRLRAEIIDPDGNVLLVTRKPATIKPLRAREPISLRLTRIIDDKNLTFKKYQCEDGFHLAAAHTPTEAVIRLGNRRLVLETLSHSASRKSYLDEHGNRLDMAEQQTTLRVDEAEHTGCHIAQEQKTVTKSEDAAPENPASEQQREIQPDSGTKSSRTEDASTDRAAASEKSDL